MRARTAAIGVVLTYAYGTAEIIGFDGPRRVEIYRPFVVHPREPWTAEVTERPMCLDHRDASPTVSTYAHQLGETGPHVRAYDSRCSCCYLHINHTTALHDARIGATKPQPE